MVKAILINGLARKLEDCAVVRRTALKFGNVCYWPSAKQTGVMSLSNVALNSEALKIIIDLWCPQNATAKTISLEDTKAQARCYSNFGLL